MLNTNAHPSSSSTSPSHSNIAQSYSSTNYDISAWTSVPGVTSFTASCYSACALPDSLNTWVNLTTLSLTSSYGFTAYPADLSALTKLKTLTISATYATYPTYGGVMYNASSFLAGVTSLTSLSISSVADYGFNAVPNFSGNKGLLTFAYRGGATSMPDDIFTGFVNLTSVDVSYCTYLAKLPSSLSTCTKLNSVLGSYTNLTSDDSWFDMTNTQVQTISAGSMGAKAFPSSLCKLSAAPYLNQLVTILFDYNLVSSVPSCLGDSSAAKLGYISFYNSNFTSFPSSLALPGLTRLGIRYNYSPINANLDFSAMTQLRALDLTGCKIYGAFPTGLSSATALGTLYLGGNRFQGTMPSNFFNTLTVLTYFDISQGNQLSGAFPDLTQARSLQTISASGNHFTSIPDSIRNCTYLSSIDFSDNLLTTLPSDTIFKSFAYLGTFYMGGNTELTGLLPTWWASSGTLAYLNLSYTNFYGDFPNLNSSSLRNVYISASGLNGRIGGFTKASYLYDLRLDRNLLTGSIPNSIGNTGGATGLSFLDVSYNLLSGPLPAYFTSLTQLTTANLNDNGFTGAVPNVGIMTNLAALKIQNNQFDLCAANPGITYRLSGKCNVTNNLFPNACDCANFYTTYCAVNVTCPAPDFVPVATPYTIPVPVKGPTAAPVTVPVFTPADTTTPQNPTSAPTSTSPTSTPTSSTVTEPNEPAPTAAASAVVLSVAVVLCAALASALFL